MTADQLASELCAWGAQQGFYPLHQVTPGDTPITPEVEAGYAAATQATQNLTTAQVYLITANNAENRITLHHNKRLLKKQVSALPKELLGISIHYIKSGGEPLIDEKVAEMAAGVTPAVVDSCKYCCGSSIGVGIFRGGGTLGCLVEDEVGNIFGLTNNHVTGGCNHSPINLPVVAPAPLDMSPGSPDPFCIGHHVNAIPLKIGIPAAVDHTKNLDAAIFRLADPQLVSPLQRNSYDTPTEIADPSPGMRVKKAGRTTGITEGVIYGQAAGATSTIYNVHEKQFSGHAYFEPVFLVKGAHDLFADRGDSGSLVIGLCDDGEWRSVGLVYAVLNEFTYILPIRPILAHFNVKLISQHEQENDNSNPTDPQADPGG